MTRVASIAISACVIMVVLAFAVAVVAFSCPVRHENDVSARPSVPRTPAIFASEVVNSNTNVEQAAEEVSGMLEDNEDNVKSASSTAVRATLQFNAFRGYFVVVGGQEVEVPTEKIGRAERRKGGGMGKGFTAGDQVMFDPEAAPDQPLVTWFTEPAPVVAPEAPAIADVSATAATVTPIAPPTELDRRQALGFVGMAAGAALFSSNNAPDPASAPERAAARKQAADAAVAAQMAKKAETERAVRAAKATAARQAEEDEAAAKGQAAAAAVADEVEAAASWTVAWSTAGDAPYFLNTRTGEMTWVAPMNASHKRTAAVPYTVYSPLQQLHASLTPRLAFAGGAGQGPAHKGAAEDGAGGGGVGGSRDLVSEAGSVRRV